MAVKLSTKYADNFISDEALASMRAEAESAFEKVMTGSGDGSDYSDGSDDGSSDDGSYDDGSYDDGSYDDGSEEY